MAKETQDFCSSPALVMALGISDGLSPLQDACGTGGAGSPAAPWPFRGVGPGAGFGGCQEQAVLKQLPLSAWHQQQFVRLSRKPGEKAVGSTGAVGVCLWPPSPSAAPSRQHPRLLQRHLPQMGTGWRGLPGRPRNPWGTADRAASHRWANPLPVPRVLYLETEKGGCARPFLFFTMLVFHSGKYRQVKIFTPTSRIQSYVSSGSFTARFRMPQ